MPQDILTQDKYPKSPSLGAVSRQKHATWWRLR